MVNSKRRLNVEFDQSGVAVHVGDPKGATWDLALDGYGRGKSMNLVSPAAPQADANRVEYHHGGLTEWYVNGPLGLEQGFTLARPPATGDGQAEQPLTIALALSGDLTASLDSAGTGLTLKQSDGQAVLSYAGLSAQDAAGKLLKCWLELHGSQLRLRIDDAGARYPIVVDPYMQVAKLTNSLGVAGDQLGFTVAIGGNTVVAGAYSAGSNYQGAAYVFVEPASGSWANISDPVVLPDPGGIADDQFGYSVAISGNTIVASADGATIGTNPANPYQGAAYVFTAPTVNGVADWSSATVPVATLLASDGTAQEQLGISVAINETGDTIVVGASTAQIGNNVEQGAAYVFDEPTDANGVPTGWISKTSNAKLIASDGAARDYFGDSVAISGNTVVVGARDAGTRGGTTQEPVAPGAVYVFVKPASGGWVTPATYNVKLTTNGGGTPGDSLGNAVAIRGNTVVAGAEGTTVMSGPGAGAVEVFELQLGTPPVVGAAQNESADLTASNAASGYLLLGSSVSINETGDTIVAGAWEANITVGSNEYLEQGAAYVFDEPMPGGWAKGTETAQFTASDPAQGSLFGISVGISGSTIVAGALGVSSRTGAAYVFVPASPNVAALYSNPGPIDFGAVQVNTAGTYSLTLTNPTTNTSAFQVTGASLAGSDSAFFSITSVVCNGNMIAPANYSSFSVTLNPNGMDECAFTLQFLPNLDHNGYAEDLLVATTATTSNASPGPGGTGQGFLMLGDGVEPYANFTNSTSGSPTQVNFGNVAENVPVTQTVTVTDTGDGPLIISGVLILPLGIGYSLPQYTCSQGGSVSSPPYPITLTPNDSCTYTLQFYATALGTVTATFLLEDNAMTGESNLPSTAAVNGPLFTQSMQLSGTGVTTTATTTTVTSTSSSFMGFPLPSGYALVGNPVAVNFSVQPAAPSTLVPTGTVIVQDGSEEVCTPTGTLTSGEGGKGSCPLTIVGLGNGSTTLYAQYVPDAASLSAGLLGSYTAPPLFAENLVQIVYCGPLPAPQSAPPGQATVFSFSVCLAGDVNAAVTATCAQLTGTPLSCSPPPTVTEIGNTGVYTVSITVSAAAGPPLRDRRPWPGRWPLTLVGIGLLLTMLMAHHLAWKRGMRPRLLYAAGFLFALALLLGNINGCGSPSNNGSTGTQPGQYTMNVKVSAGAFSVTVPVTLNVT